MASAGPASGLFPNPFRKRVTLTASERTKMVASQTLMSVLNTKPCCYKNRNYTLTKNNITKVKNYSTLLDYTRGFFLLEASCNNIDEYVNTVSDGLFSYIDMRDLKDVNYVPCDYNPLYLLDQCRIIQGLIVPKAKIKPTHKERKFSFPIPIRKISDCSCALPPCNNCGHPDIHDVPDDLCHHHYFPANSRIVYYSHKHEFEGHPEFPYPHPNFPATNQLSLFSYLKKSSKRRCCQALTYNRNYATIAGGKCNSYINRNFAKQVPYTGKSCRCWSCNACEKTHGLKY